MINIFLYTFFAETVVILMNELKGFQVLNKSKQLVIENKNQITKFIGCMVLLLIVYVLITYFIVKIGYGVNFFREIKETNNVYNIIEGTIRHILMSYMSMASILLFLNINREYFQEEEEEIIE